MRKIATVLIATAVVLLPSAAYADAAADFKAKCAMCHGADGKGTTPVGKTMKLRDLGSAEVQKQTDAELAQVISDGKGKMPPQKGKLDKAAIDGLVAFIRTLKK